MKINIKFKPGDTVYYIKPGKIEKDKVRFIDIAILDRIIIRYKLIKDTEYSYYEDALFASKEELINILKTEA
jgi:hypothetical protein